MTTNRREFLKGVAISAGAGIAAGCACAKGSCGSASGAPMRNFRCVPMKNGIRVGVVGVGARGFGAVTRLLMVPGVTITAVCDIRPEFAEKGAYGVACAYATILIAIVYAAIVVMNFCIRHFGTSKQMRVKEEG